MWSTKKNVDVVRRSINKIQASLNCCEGNVIDFGEEKLCGGTEISYSVQRGKNKHI